MKKTKLFFVTIFLLLLNNVKSKELSNNVIASIDNSIITELDLNKEINFIKYTKRDLSEINFIELSERIF